MEEVFLNKKVFVNSLKTLPEKFTLAKILDHTLFMHKIETVWDK